MNEEECVKNEELKNEITEKILNVLPKEVLFEDMKKNMPGEQKFLAKIDDVMINNWPRLGLFFMFISLLISFVDASEFNTKQLMMMSMFATPGYFFGIPTIIHYARYIKKMITTKNEGSLEYGDFKFIKEKEDENEFYNNAVKNQLSLKIYEKIAPYFDEEEMRQILSWRLTYKDLGLRDFTLKNSQKYNTLKRNIRSIEEQRVKNKEEKEYQEFELIENRRKKAEEELAKKLVDKNK